MDEKIKGIKTSSIHERIKLLRVQNGMTLKDVALKMGKDESYRSMIHKWEKGTKPGFENLVKIAEVFNASVEWLISGEDK